MAKDLEGKWRGSCRNHPVNRFGACEMFGFVAGSSKCANCGCVARCHVVLGSCEEHSYCSGYVDLHVPTSTGECLNCGCSPKKHMCKPAPLEEDNNSEMKAESPNVWDNIRKLAGEQRRQQNLQNPPIRKHQRGQHGGLRAKSGRKKSKPKELLVTPVKVKNRKLGHYIPKGKKEFIPFEGTEFTIAAVEDALCNHFLGVNASAAKSSFNFHVMRTLKGPPLTSDSHLSGTSYYFWWDSSLCVQDSDDEDDNFDISMDPSLSARSTDQGWLSSKKSLNENVSMDPFLSARSTDQGWSSSKKSLNQNGFSFPESVRGQLSIKKRQIDTMRYIRTARRIPTQPIPTPSKILLLGKSVRRPFHDGIPVEVYQYQVSDDWCEIKVDGPQHAVVEINGFPDTPFASGSFQMAFTTRVITPCKFLSGDTPSIFKQHNIDEYGLPEDGDASTISEESLLELQTANEKKTAKEVQVAAVCHSLCCHFTQECLEKIRDFGKEICVLPSVHVKLLSGQFPPWGLIEPHIRGRWHKFLNNDGQAVAMDNPDDDVLEFCNKSLCFAHWTYHHFKGKAVVCDLQGSDFHLTDLEIASGDKSLFGIGNLSEYALEMFKQNHRCNVYCAALELEDLHASTNNGMGQVFASPEVVQNVAAPSQVECADVVELLKSKYGEGETTEQMCPKCERTFQCLSAGVFADESGCVRVYSTGYDMCDVCVKDEEFFSYEY